MNNLEYWNKLSTPPQAALKKIKAGRMKGMSDINPQWRMKVMTETFGPVGIGWKYSIDKMWLEPGSDNQVCAFVLVSVCIKHGDDWSEPIPGVGGSMLIAKESRGPFTSDEAYKMATTDALSVAFKAIGVAADVYMGIFDGAKYSQPEPQIQQKSLAVLKKEAEKSNTSSQALIDWYNKNDKQVQGLPTADNTAMITYLSSLKKKHSPPTITCPENNKPAVLADCKESECSKDCAEYQKAIMG